MDGESGGIYVSIKIIIIMNRFSQKDYVCFDFVPRHHNVIRYRKGLAVIKDDFSHVCSWVQFPNKEEWRYDLFLSTNLFYFLQNKNVSLLCKFSR